MSRTTSIQLKLFFCCYIVGCLQFKEGAAEIVHARAYASPAANTILHVYDNALDHDATETSAAATGDESATVETVPAASSSAPHPTDYLDKMSWQCANNASCIYDFANGLIDAYRRGETIKLGILELVKVSKNKKANSTQNSNAETETGRGMSTFVDFISGNAIRVPVGPMVFSVQRSEEDDNYIELALLKKSVNQARRGGGGGGGLLGGGIGGSGLRRKPLEKKKFQILIPLYLAATTFGWTLLAVKAVGLLTLKALAISKLAFIVAAMVVIKKLMDNASEKMMYQFPEHTPYMMPAYSGLDYAAMHSLGGAEIATNDMYPAALHLAAAAPVLPHAAHPGLESLTAESHLHHNFANVQNNTQMLAALSAAGLGQKVKREDNWIARRRDYSVEGDSLGRANVKASNDEQLAVAAAAEVVAAENMKDEQEDDQIFNEEESVKDTLEFLATAARHPLVYNYLKPQNPYYRA